ncbi:hypothetical protein SANTM175S_01605 [Streptomyces antimycoticus]
MSRDSLSEPPCFGRAGPHWPSVSSSRAAIFALLVTRIPALQDRYGISDGLLPLFLAAVPILAGVGSVGTEHLVKRMRPGLVLRAVQPVVSVALLAAGSGTTVWQLAAALAVFGLTVGALDASMNMLGVSLQRAYGRSIMLGFHGAYSLGGIAWGFPRRGWARTGTCRCPRSTRRWWPPWCPSRSSPAAGTWTAKAITQPITKPITKPTTTAPP